MAFVYSLDWKFTTERRPGEPPILCVYGRGGGCTHSRLRIRTSDDHWETVCGYHLAAALYVIPYTNWTDRRF